MLLPKRWQSCMMLLIFVLSDDTGATIQSRAATAAVCGKDLQPRSRVLMGFASLADTMSSSGLVFCVANPSADANALRNGLDWACGPGAANCTAIQIGQPCYEPNNLTALASYAYNDYYQRTRASGGSCSFNNTAMTTTSDPSHGSCIFTGRTVREGPRPQARARLPLRAVLDRPAVTITSLLARTSIELLPHRVLSKWWHVCSLCCALSGAACKAWYDSW